MLVLALAGFSVAFAGSMGVTGPVGVIVMHAGLAGQVARGARIGLGAGLAQVPFAAVSLFGAASLITASPAVSRGVHAVSAVLLLAVAAWAWQKGESAGEPVVERRGADFLLGLATTGLNPGMLLSWGAVAAAVAAGGHAQPGLAPAAIFGVSAGLGAAIAFACLAALAERLRRAGGPAVSRLASRVVAVGLAILGLVSVAQALGWVEG